MTTASPIAPSTFAQAWLDAWNRHDVEAVLAHFSEDVVFSSPVAGRLLPDSGGVLHGKAELRRYWLEALPHAPNLRFELLGVYAGVDSVAIHYRNERGGLVVEVLVFDGGLVARGHATYLDGAGQPSPID